eukprot:11174398-Lingulodinium_polyedra.AAC.1
MANPYAPPQPRPTEPRRLPCAAAPPCSRPLPRTARPRHTHQRCQQKMPPTLRSPPARARPTRGS